MQASDLAGFTFTGGGTSALLTISGAGADPILLNDAGSDGTSLDITVDPDAAITFNTTELLSSLTIEAGAKATMSANGQSVLVTNSLSLASSLGAWTGTLDLTNNGLIVNGGTLSTITNQLASGYSGNGGYWNGTGIISSSAASDPTYLTTLGVMSNLQSGNASYYSTFDGQSVTSSDILVQYTYYGDLDFNGEVDGNDYSLLDNGYMQHLTGWFNGDVNYDGTVDGSDYTLVDNAFNTQGSPIVDQGTGVPLVPQERSIVMSGQAGSHYFLSIDSSSVVTVTEVDPNGDATNTQWCPIAQLSSLTLGTAAADDLTIDTTYGNPVPSGGISFLGDQITIDGPADTSSHLLVVGNTSATFDAQSISYPAGTTVTFTAFDGDPNNTSIHVEDGGTVYLANNGALASLQIDAGGVARVLTTATASFSVSGSSSNSGTLVLEDASITPSVASDIQNNGGGQIICDFDQDSTISDLSVSQVTYVVADGATATIDTALSATENLLINAGSTLDINSGGMLTVNGNLTIGEGSAINLDGGSLIVNGSLTADSGSALNVSGGTLTVSDGGDASLSSGAVLNLSGGSMVIAGELDSVGDLSISDGTLSGTGTFNLGGTTVIDDGGLLEDSGILTQQGDLTIVNGGIFTVDAGASMNAELGSVTLATGAALNDGGEMIFNGAAANIGGGVLTVQSAGQLEITPTSNVQISTDGLLDDQGSLTVDTGASLENSGTLDLSDGTLAVAGAVYNNGQLTAESGDITITGVLISSLSSSTTLDTGTTVDSYGVLSITDGSTFTVSGADLILSGEMIIDQGTFALNSGSVELTASSSIHLRNGGLFNIEGGTFSSQIIVDIESGGTLQTSVPLNPGQVNVTDLGILSLAAGGGLTGGQVRIDAGGTLLNASALDLSAALSSGILVFAQGSTVLNTGTLTVEGNLNLGVVNLQSFGSIQTTGDVTGGGTYTPPATLPYTHSIIGGSVSGTVAQSGTDVYSYTYTPTSETYSDNDSDTASFSDLGSSSYPSDGGTDTGDSNDSGGSTYSEQSSISASLVNGLWVWSGTDSGSSSSSNTTNYSNDSIYVEYVDGFRIAGTTNNSGGSSSTDTSNWNLTLNADGTWTINSDTSTSSGSDHSTYSYNGGDSYTENLPGGSFSASEAENGSDAETGNYSTSSDFSDGAWVNSGASSGNWNVSGSWSESFQSNVSLAMLGASEDASKSENIGENWTSNGSSGSTLNSDGSWILASGSDTDTDHNYDNGAENDNASLSDGSFSATLTSNGIFSNSEDTTLNLNVASGQWIGTGTGSKQSSDSGSASGSAAGTYVNNESDSLGEPGADSPVAGNANVTFQSNYSDNFNTQSTLGTNGIWTSTGNGTSHEYQSGIFTFSGSQLWNLNSVTSSSIESDSFTMNLLYVEGGSQVQSSDVTTTWVLDPNGNWRAANQQIVNIGESKAHQSLNSMETFLSSVYQSIEFPPYKSTNSYKYNASFQSDFSYNDHLTITTDINGVQTFSGTGTGTGSINGSADWSTYSTASTFTGSSLGLYIIGNDARNKFSGGWTQNYASNTLIPTGQDTANVTTQDTGDDIPGGGTSIQDYTFTAGYPISVSIWGGLFFLFTDGPGQNDNFYLSGITFNTGSSTTLGVIGTPTVVGSVQSMSVTATTRIAPAPTFKQPTWITVTSSAAEGIVVGVVVAGGVIILAPLVVSGGAVLLVAVGVEAATATAVSGAVVTTGLGVLGTAGLLSTGYSSYVAYQKGDWDTLAFNLGQVAGGFIVGYSGGGRLLGEGVSGSPSQVPPTWWNIFADRSLNYDPAFPNGSILQWLASAPTPQSGSFVLTFASSIIDWFF